MRETELERLGHHSRKAPNNNTNGVYDDYNILQNC